jgi:polyisoprenoid-binding protein YceI
MQRQLLLWFALLALPASLPGQTSTWSIDSAHSAAQFSVRHMMISNVRGEFSKVTGTLTLNEKDITQSSVQATIDVSTIDTREPMRDNHLKSPDFFDVAKFPVMTFQSKKVASEGNGRLKVWGDLTMHGVTREVLLEVAGPTDAVKDPGGNLRRGISATTVINRKDFGLTWNKALETGGVLVGDEVTITVDAEFKKAN